MHPINSPPALTARAGEGGGLPKGLSLFRFILFSFILLGGVYGGASLYFNSLPVPGDVPPGGKVPAAQWQPSPVWLPSWALIKAHAFVQHSSDGYRYSSRLGKAIFGSLSISIGMLIFATSGWFLGEFVRKWWVKTRGK